MINLALPVSTIISELPAEFIKRFSTVEYKFFDSSYESDVRDRIFHSSLSLVQDDFIEVMEGQRGFEFIRRHDLRRFSLDIGPRHATCATVDAKYVGTSRK